MQVFTCIMQGDCLAFFQKGEKDMAQVKFGTGTIFKDGEKWRWQGFYTDANGKKHRPSRTFKTEQEALKFQAEQTTQSEIKKAMKSKDLTLEEVFLLWCEEIKAGKVNISETTRKNSIRNWRAHLLPLAGNDPIKTLSTIKLQRYFNKLKAENRTARTIYNIYADLLKVIKFAIKKGIIYINPIENIEIEKPKQSKQVVNVMTFKEYEALASNEKNKQSYYYPAIIFLAETGLRVEELAIKKGDYITTDSGLAYIIINKSIVRALKEDDKTTELRLTDNVKTQNSERKVPLNIFARNAIEMQLEQCKEKGIHSPFIFCTKTGAMIDQSYLFKALHRFCENAGIEKKGLHSLRKLYINHTLQNGITPFDLAKITGHSMQTMFNYYHNLDDELLQKIANASESRK